MIDSDQIHFFGKFLANLRSSGNFVKWGKSVKYVRFGNNERILAPLVKKGYSMSQLNKQGIVVEGQNLSIRHAGL